MYVYSHILSSLILCFFSLYLSLFTFLYLLDGFIARTAIYSVYTFIQIVVTQFYITEAENEYVIKGNAAVMKCKIPSFVADFVQVEAWIIAEDGTVLTATNDSSASYGYFISHSQSHVVSFSYRIPFYYIFILSVVCVCVCV